MSSGERETKAHELHCVADCGIVMPMPVEGYASILVLAVIIAAVWIPLRRRKRRGKRPGARV